ncbi:MAG: phytanoyl-CoA dioxygenase family protein [Flavobacteriales bacterium]|nr:phytanoyl-CoA dioxygenase family protein [Flavobacteriales bacterium]
MSNSLRHPRFNEPLFKNAAIQEELALKGFSVQPFLHATEVATLLHSYEDLLSMLPDGLPDTFCPSGRFEDPVLRNFARNAIDAVVPSRLNDFFVDGRASLMGGTFLIKPVGANTALSPHQDSSHVDETCSFSVYAWIPLVDTTVENGAFHVIPQSHLWGNKHRSLNVPWCFAGKEDALLRLSEPVTVKCGDVCFFEGALIHSSPPNHSNDTRVALNYFIKPESQRFLHHFVDERTPKGKVEVYGVDIDFFYSEDFESRPNQNLFLRYEDAIDQNKVMLTFTSL